MGKDTFEIKEESDYGQKEVSMKDILLGHIRKISEISSKEFIEGYWEKKPINLQGSVMLTKVYHEDSREAYSNAVDFLVDILYPKGDKAFKDIVDKHELLKLDDMDKLMKMREKRKIFKEINKMFERTNFFANAEFLEE